MLKVPPEFFSDIFVIHIGKKLCYTMSFLYSLQIMDSELMHSIVGSYLKPPERVCVPSVTQSDESSQTHYSVNLEVTSSKMLRSPNSQGNANKKSYLKLEKLGSMLYKTFHHMVSFCFLKS